MYSTQFNRFDSIEKNKNDYLSALRNLSCQQIERFLSDNKITHNYLTQNANYFCHFTEFKYQVGIFLYINRYSYRVESSSFWAHDPKDALGYGNQDNKKEKERMQMVRL